jgi:hypothetical protein
MKKAIHNKLLKEIDNAFSPDGRELSEGERFAKSRLLARLDANSPRRLTPKEVRIFINNRPKLDKFIADTWLVKKKGQVVSDELFKENREKEYKKETLGNLIRIQTTLAENDRDVSLADLSAEIKNGPPLQVYAAMAAARENDALRKFNKRLIEVVIALGTSLTAAGIYTAISEYKKFHPQSQQPGQSLPPSHPKENDPPKGTQKDAPATPVPLSSAPPSDPVQLKMTPRGPRGPNGDTVCSLLDEGKKVLLPATKGSARVCLRPNRKLLLEPQTVSQP